MPQDRDIPEQSQPAPVHANSHEANLFRGLPNFQNLRVEGHTPPTQVLRLSYYCAMEFVLTLLPSL